MFAVFAMFDVRCLPWRCRVGSGARALSRSARARSAPQTLICISERTSHANRCDTIRGRSQHYDRCLGYAFATTLIRIVTMATLRHAVPRRAFVRLSTWKWHRPTRIRLLAHRHIRGERKRASSPCDIVVGVADCVDVRRSAIGWLGDWFRSTLLCVPTDDFALFADGRWAAGWYWYR